MKNNESCAKLSFKGGQLLSRPCKLWEVQYRIMGINDQYLCPSQRMLPTAPSHSIQKAAKSPRYLIKSKWPPPPRKYPKQEIKGRNFF
jgi:hypothetical protein